MGFGGGGGIEAPSSSVINSYHQTVIYIVSYKKGFVKGIMRINVDLYDIRESVTYLSH